MIDIIMHAYRMKTKNDKCVPQWLIIGKPISQYASYAATVCSVRYTAV